MVVDMIRVLVKLDIMKVSQFNEWQVMKLTEKHEYYN